MRAFLIVLDSVGIGAAPDAAEFGDDGCATLQHTAAAVGGLSLPSLADMGLGNIPALLPGGGPEISGVVPAARPTAGYGAMRPLSKGKDTTTGHWELAGLRIEQPFHVFPAGPPSFPPELVTALERRTGRRIIGDKAASGTAIIEELGATHMRDGSLIAYTSADSVFQIAAHEEVVPLEELYAACKIARELCNPLRVGRVIARPFLGKPGSFRRTVNRRDFSFPLPEPTVLDRLSSAGIPVIGVGKIEDIFDRRGLTESIHTGTNIETQAALTELVRTRGEGLIFANLIDFDMLYGHRRDARGYAAALEQTDSFLASFSASIRADDLLVITADHGNDPTFAGTDHTREYVPLLVAGPNLAGACLGVRQGFFDAAQSLAAFFGLPRLPRGTSFLP